MIRTIRSYPLTRHGGQWVSLPPHAKALCVVQDSTGFPSLFVEEDFERSANSETFTVYAISADEILPTVPLQYLNSLVLFSPDGSVAPFQPVHFYITKP